MAIYIGPAGTGGSSAQGFINVKNAGMDAVEIEFTYSIWMTTKDAGKIRELNKKLGLKLSIHAPYYINLNSEDKRKILASKKRILGCCEIGNIVGAKYVIFHPGYYSGMSREQTYQNIKKQVLDMQKIIKRNKWHVILAPETTGKPSQFGDLEDLIRMKKETGCHLCIDFAHLKARYNGKMSYEEMAEAIKKANLGHLPCHFSGIEFTEKGERRHLITSEKEIKEFLRALKKHKVDCTIINESPDPLGDALKTKKILSNLGGS